jgi:hypothetical protein
MTPASAIGRLRKSATCTQLTGLLTAWNQSITKPGRRAILRAIRVVVQPYRPLDERILAVSVRHT